MVMEKLFECLMSTGKIVVGISFCQDFLLFFLGWIAPITCAFGDCGLAEQNQCQFDLRK